MVPKMQSRRCKERAEYRVKEASIVKINKLYELIVVMADDAMATHRVRKECMGTRPTQEIPADLLI